MVIANPPKLAPPVLRCGDLMLSQVNIGEGRRWGLTDWVYSRHRTSSSFSGHNLD